MSNGYGYDYGSTASTTAVAGAFAVYMVVGIAIAVLMVVAMWKMFTKAGKPGWASIVPIYNLVVLFQIVGMNPWLILLSLIPLVGSVAMFILSIMLAIKLAKAFGKGTGFAVGLIFLGPIFYLILGFGDAQYVGIPE